MKLIKLAFTCTLALSALLPSVAQQQSQSSAVLRKRDRQENARPAVTDRMKNAAASSSALDAERQWMRVIYRQLDLTKPRNAPLYFPEEANAEGDENLFRIIMRLLASNQLPAYEYLDGREIFNDQYRIKVKDMLDRFHILYSDARGSSEKNPKFTIEESDVPANEVLTYYILEKWEFDTRHNKTKTTVEAICPVLHRSGDFGGEAIRYPMFWVKMDDIRPYLMQQQIFVDDDNNLAKYTYDDFFAMNMYGGEIYKTRNLRNKSMMQMFPDPDDMKRAQDSIQNRLESFDKKLWVPSREEVIAAREAKEKGDTITIVSRDEQPKAKRSSRSSRSSKKKEPKVKESKVKQNNSGSAVRSVRRRR